MRSVRGCEQVPDAGLCEQVPRTLRVQLDAIQSGSTYGAFLRQRQGVARHLTEAREETAARQFRLKEGIPKETVRRFGDLANTITLQRGRFEILYTDGADLMRQMAEFLAVAGANREEFFALTESADDPSR